MEEPSGIKQSARWLLHILLFFLYFSIFSHILPSVLLFHGKGNLFLNRCNFCVVNCNIKKEFNCIFCLCNKHGEPVRRFYPLFFCLKKINRDGSLYGYNTDYYGFLYLLDKNGISVKNKKVLVLGNGGVAHSASRRKRVFLGFAIISTAALRFL